jgi:heme-degrading monooxygenase HmoA
LSVILINPFEVPDGTNDEDFLRRWERAADYMRQQPGFVSTRLHRALRPDARFRFVNVAEWESPQAFQAAKKGTDGATLQMPPPRRRSGSRR